MGLAATALDFQSLLLHGGKMRAARDEGDIGARFRQRRAKSPADPSGADNRNPHEIPPRLKKSLSDPRQDGAAGISP
jgi:hypothetical protein